MIFINIIKNLFILYKITTFLKKFITQNNLNKKNFVLILTYISVLSLCPVSLCEIEEEILNQADLEKEDINRERLIKICYVLIGVCLVVSAFALFMAYNNGEFDSDNGYSSDEDNIPYTPTKFINDELKAKCERTTFHSTRIDLDKPPTLIRRDVINKIFRVKGVDGRWHLERRTVFFDARPNPTFIRMTGETPATTLPPVADIFTTPSAASPPPGTFTPPSTKTEL